MLKKIILSICVIGVMNISYGASPAVSHKKSVVEETDYADVSKPVFVTDKTPHFKIKLAANPTTGYSWFYVADKLNSFVLPVKQEYFTPTAKLPGRGGYSVWDFEVDPAAFRVPTVMKINLIYARAWEVNKPAQELHLTVVSH